MHILFLIKTTIEGIFGWQANIGFRGEEFGNLRMLKLRASPTE